MSFPEDPVLLRGWWPGSSKRLVQKAESEAVLETEKRKLPCVWQVSGRSPTTE